MPPDGPFNWSDLPHRLRSWRLESAARFALWRARVRDEPRLLWESSLVRCGLWLLVGIALFFAGRTFVSAWMPPADPITGVVATPTATLFVTCVDPDCGASGVETRPMDFDAWPLPCARCGKATVYRATRCPGCSGWYAPTVQERCGRCADRRRDEAQRAREEDRRRFAHPDDAEDPWSP